MQSSPNLGGEEDTPHVKPSGTHRNGAVAKFIDSILKQNLLGFEPGGTAETWGSDDETIFFMSKNNLYRIDVATGNVFTTKVNRDRFGRVLRENIKEWKEVSDPMTISAMHQLLQFSKMATESRALFAKNLSGDNEYLQKVIEKHLVEKKGNLSPQIHNGITFYAVSRDFSGEDLIGFKDGQAYLCSILDAEIDDPDSEKETRIEAIGHDRLETILQSEW